MKAARRALLPLTLFVAVCACAFADPEGPLRAAWYSFDSAGEPGRSVGLTPWPAYPFRAEIGPGKVGSALVMAGEAANGLMLPNPAAFFGEEAVEGTIALWARPGFEPTEDDGQRVLIDFMKENRNTRVDGYQTVLLTEGVKLAAQAALGRRMIVDSPLSPGRWTHIALTWNAAEGCALYIDGEKAAEIGAGFTATPLSAWPGRIGSHTPSGGFPFKGSIDEVRLLNRRVSDAQVRELADASEPWPKLKVSGWRTGTLQVANLTDARVTVWPRVWRAEEGADDLAWGRLPLPEHEFGSDEVYVGGPSGLTESLAEPVSVAPHETASLDAPLPADYLKRARLSLMVDGDGDSREAAGADFAGLTCEATPHHLVAGRPAGLQVSLANDLGRAYSAAVRGVLVRDMGEEALHMAGRTVDLEHGARTQLGLDLAPAGLAPGRYFLRLQAKTERGEWRPLRRVTIPVFEDTDYRTLFGSGAAYVGRTFGEDLLPAMAGDGVKVLRRSRGQSFREDDDLISHGFRAWYMAAFSANSICADPELWQRTEEYGRQLGAGLREKPAVLNQTMLGEGLMRTPCYCDHCNDAFREWLRAKYDDITGLNDAWGTQYESFRQIDQLGSPRDVSAAAQRMALMQRELPGDLVQRWRELFSLSPSRAIEWRRWHDGLLIDWYRAFAEAFHSTNRHRTALSEQPCWPNFKHHVLFALGETADLGGMDLYLPGELPTTLGYASELMCNFDMNASIFQGKPLWVHELYVQDNSPALLPEAQGWWLVGRGYSMLTYFTYDYYKEGIRASLPLIFGMFGPELKPYPCYESFKRFSQQMAEFHRRYDAFGLRREEPRVAVFLGDDVSVANWLETGGQTWGAAGVHGHIGAYWLAERNGYPVEFINDDGFDELDREQALIVPWTHVIRPSSLKQIMRFARSGGTVILDGPVALYDDNLRAYEPSPGGRIMRELGVRFAESKDEPNTLTIAEDGASPGLKPGVSIAARGVPVDAQVSDGKVLATDEHGSPALVVRALGRGKVYWLLTNVGRVHRGRAPDPNAVALWGAMIESAGASSRHEVRLADAAPGGEPDADLDHGGAGLKQQDALCDVSVRLRGDREAFLFIVSFFNATKGEVLLRVPRAKYDVVDALTDDDLGFREIEEGILLPIDLPPFGSRVVRVRCAEGAPFKDW